MKSYSASKITERIKLARCVVLTAILFGNAIYTLTMQWIGIFVCDSSGKWRQSFTADEQLVGIVNQGNLSLFALVYLADSNDDFKRPKGKTRMDSFTLGIRFYRC